MVDGNVAMIYHQGLTVHVHDDRLVRMALNAPMTEQEDYNHSTERPTAITLTLWVHEVSGNLSDCVSGH